MPDDMLIVDHVPAGGTAATVACGTTAIFRTAAARHTLVPSPDGESTAHNDPIDADVVDYGVDASTTGIW